jgi:hypothetical protein
VSSLTLRTSAIAVLAVIAGCSNSSVCSGAVGPETLSVDASSIAEQQPDESEVRVCIAPEDDDRGDPSCSEPGSVQVSLTYAGDDYPAVLDYYVGVRTGSSWVYTEDWGGTHHMRCVATTTNIVLPITG